MMNKLMLKTMLFVCALVFSVSCSSYSDYKQLEINKQVIPEAIAYIEEAAYLLDVLRYGEFEKNGMFIRMGYDYDPHTKTYSIAPHVYSKFNYPIRHTDSISIYSKELLDYLPQQEIDALLYLTKLGLMESNSLKHTFQTSSGYFFGSITIDGVRVFISTEPHKANQKYYYIEQVRGYYIQVVPYWQARIGGPREYYRYNSQLDIPKDEESAL